MFEKFSIINSWTALNYVVDGLFEEAEVKTAGQRVRSEWIHRKLLEELERVNRSKHINTRLQRLTVLGKPQKRVEWLEWPERREELERSEDLEQMQVPEQIEGQQQRKLREQNEERAHLQQLKLLERLEQLMQLERLGQCGQLEEIRKFQEFVDSRYFKENRVIRQEDNRLNPYELLERNKVVREDSPREEDTLLELGKLLDLEFSYHDLDNLLPSEVSKLLDARKLLLTPCEHLHQSWPKRFSQFKQLVHLFWCDLESNEKFNFVETFHFGTKTFTNAPLELHNLPDGKEKGLFTSMLPCVSPDGKWIAIRLEGDEITVQLYRGQRQHHNAYWRKPVYVIKEVEHFAFTKDSVFFLYLTVQRSLRTLSLASGTILTSLSGVIPLSFIPEKQSGYRSQDDDEETSGYQAGYRFQVDDEENIIFVKDFPPVFFSGVFPFLRAGPMQVAFASADTILVLYSDSTLALMENNGTGIASEQSLTHPCRGLQQVKKAQFSVDGNVIVIHQGTNILLYRTVNHNKCPDSVFKTNDDFIVLHFTFSADSTLLLFCIRRNSRLSFFVWNVQKKVLTASFDPPGLMSEDCCCCFSSNNTELIICSEFYIEFWDHSSQPCRFLRRKDSRVPYSEVYKLTACTVSPENDLLAYCIADRIFLCQLKTSTDQSIVQLPPAHLGKVEFCQFLKGSRYLISYGVDGNVFLWDLHVSERKAVSFANIAHGRESIVSMAVSAEGDKVVCVTSFGRLNVIKPCGLKDAMREPTAAIQNYPFPDNTGYLDAAEPQIEEMEFMSCSDDNEDSDELLD